MHRQNHKVSKDKKYNYMVQLEDSDEATVIITELGVSYSHHKRRHSATLKKMLKSNQKIKQVKKLATEALIARMCIQVPLVVET